MSRCPLLPWTTRMLDTFDQKWKRHPTCYVHGAGGQGQRVKAGLWVEEMFFRKLDILNQNECVQQSKRPVEVATMAIRMGWCCPWVRHLQTRVCYRFPFVLAFNINQIYK